MSYSPFAPARAEGWDSAQPLDEETHHNAGYPASLTLGQVIDGYLRLSDREKAIFSAACLGGSVAASAPTVAPTGAPTSLDVPKGHTRDPKTGKVFKITPKKSKTDERLRLENLLASAKKKFSEFIRNNGIVLDPSGQPTGDISDEMSKEGSRLRAGIELAKQALANYKLARPEEFLPPPNRKTGESSETLMLKSLPLKGKGTSSKEEDTTLLTRGSPRKQGVKAPLGAKPVAYATSSVGPKTSQSQAPGMTTAGKQSTSTPATEQW